MTSVDLSLDRVLADRYRLQGLLGHGGMSDVYRAEDLTGGGQVALKIVRSGDASLARRLVQEAHALEGLDHPGLVRLLDAGAIGDCAYLAMELVEGPTLVEVLRNGPVSPARAARLGGTVAGALAYVHRAGVVHRDVKPGNVLLDADGTPRLGDFGIALVSDTSTLTAEGSTLGTAAYMAPEQLEDHHVGPEADIWSLGIVLLECLTARRVYEGAAAEVVAKRLAGAVPLPSDLPTPWRLLLVGMLDHRPDRRLKDEEVEALLSGTAFDRSWVPALDVRERGTASAGAGSKPHESVAADLTALDETRVDRTALLVAPPAAPARRRRPKRRLLVEIIAVALVAGLAFALVAVFTGSPARHASGRRAAASSSPTTSTTTSSTTTTTAPGAPGSAALASLEGDVQTAQSAGTIDPITGSLVTDDASQAVDDAAAGDVVQAGTDLQQASSGLAAAVDTGAVASATGTELAGDLNTLASALGVAVPTTAASPPATTPAPAPSPAHGGGPRGDHGGRSGNQSS